VPNATDLLTTRQVHEMTGWSIPSINRWAATGVLPVARKLYGRTGARLFRRDVIEDRIREQQSAA
jgi:predicted DNA-binding transcriptional regulator AlpA